MTISPAELARATAVASSRARRRAAAALSVPLLLCAGGCNLLGALAYKTVGPNERPARYAPPQEPMLVLVENYGRPDLASSGDELTYYIVRELREHKVAPVIEPSAVSDLRSRKAAQFARMKTSEIGRELGARQILYVQLERATIETVPGSEVVTGKVVAKAKVIDAETGRTRWPTDEDAQTVSQETDPTGGQKRSPAELRSGLFQNVGFRIARLFYKYRPEFDTDREDSE